MSLSYDEFKILEDNSTTKQLSETDKMYCFTIEQYKEFVYKLKLYHGIVKDRRIDIIINIVTNYFNTTRGVLERKTRKHKVVIARQISYYLLQKYLEMI